jgi:hypothetical protein
MSLVDVAKHPVDEIVDFVRPYFSHLPEETLRSVICGHWEFGTVDAVYKDNEIVACVRWNVSSSGLIFDVLDYVVKPGEDGARLARHLIARNWHRFPSVKVIRFRRERKYPGRSARLYSIHNMLHLKERPYGR